MVEGWILLHRKIQDCDIWANNQPFDMRSAWVDLLLLANHRDAETIFDYTPLTIKRGQYLTSVRKLGARWSWSKNRTLKFLHMLESLGMIERESNNQRTLITIVKYSDYQCDEDTGRYTPKDAVVDAGMPQTKNEKNVKNEKKEYICAFDAFWKIYPRKNDKARAYKQYQARLKDGYTEDQLLTACKNYAAECKKEKREQRYIKHGATFLSANEPFLDYLKGEEDGSTNITGTNEEQRNRELDEHIRRMEAGEFDAEDEELRRMWNVS